VVTRVGVASMAMHQASLWPVSCTYPMFVMTLLLQRSASVMPPPQETRDIIDADVSPFVYHGQIALEPDTVIDFFLKPVLVRRMRGAPARRNLSVQGST